MSRSLSSSSASNHFQTIVIGAGVIGLAIARRFALQGYEVLILERESKFGLGTSSRNSEVIHAGIYYPSQSLKARLCVQGRDLLYNFCTSRNIPHKKIGKLIVATNLQQLSDDIPTILNSARLNNVNDLQFLSKEQVHHEYEPEVRCFGALFSPSTGIVDSHSFMLHLLADAEQHGSILSLCSKVHNISFASSQKGFQVHVNHDTLLHCDILCNCSGLSSDIVSSTLLHSQKIESTTRASRPRKQQYFAKGNYFRLQGYPKSPFKHLVYPVPEKAGLGIHATIDLTGKTTRFGPDVEWIHSTKVKDPDDIDLSVDSSRTDLFYAEIRKYWPTLKDDSLVPDYSGIRPKLSHPDYTKNATTTFDDFSIESCKDHNIEGFINLRGIESPGLTSSLALANFVFETLYK